MRGLTRWGSAPVWYPGRGVGPWRCSWQTRGLPPTLGGWRQHEVWVGKELFEADFLENTGCLIHILFIRCVDSKCRLMAYRDVAPACLLFCLLVRPHASSTAVSQGLRVASSVVAAQGFARLLCKSYMNDWASLQFFSSPCKAAK